MKIQITQKSYNSSRFAISREGVRFPFLFSHSKTLVTFRKKMIIPEQGSYVTIEFTTLRFILARGKVKIKEMVLLRLQRLIKY